MGSIKIDIIDNGYILSYVKESSLGQKPQLVVEYIKTMKEISEILTKQYT